MTTQEAGAKGGSSKSDAKRKASAENGKKGGRPKGSGKEKEGKDLAISLKDGLNDERKENDQTRA